MASRSARVKPAPGHPDGWDTPEPAKPEPSLEDTLYRILREAFNRSDSAARAIARLDYQLAMQHATEAEEKVALTDTVETVAMVKGPSQEFDDREFTDTFERMSFIKMVMDLAEVLKLKGILPDLLQVLIDDRFRIRVSQNRASPESQTVHGSDMAVLLHNLKRMAERRARTEPKIKSSKVARNG